jgi:RNA polymerase-interacting CarD/CdnL/TRCF family regulator
MAPVEGLIANPDDLHPGDRVVYPNQGVCTVVGVEEQDIAGQKLVLVRMRREEDAATVMVPRNKVPTIGLRRVASGEQMEGVFHYLAAPGDDPELDWKIRHRDNADRLIAGGVLGVAEVVKTLHSLSRYRPLPTKEREQYDNARHLLVNEVAVSLGVPPGLAEDYVDHALMPPAGTRFDLKPPPRPVMLPFRPRRRPAAAPAESETLDDLGLGDLGIDLAGADLGEGAAAGEGEAAAASSEGEEAAEGAAVAGDEGEATPARKAAKGKAAARARVTGKAAASPPKAAARKAAKGGARKARPRAPARPGRSAPRKPAGKGKKR